MKGRRLADTVMSDFPAPYDELAPGDYWKVLSRKHDGPLDVTNPQDRYWGSSGEKYAGNLTGTVWGVIDPLGQYGMLSIHTVREHEDGTISVRPGDGSSNSILITGEKGTWHGYIEHGVWSSV